MLRAITPSLLFSNYKWKSTYDPTHPSFLIHDMEIFCTLMKKHFHTIFNTYLKQKGGRISLVVQMYLHGLCTLVLLYGLQLSSSQSSRPLCVSNPFVDQRTLLNRCTPSRTHAPKRTCTLVNHHRPWDQCIPTLVCRASSFPQGWEGPLARSCTQSSHFPN
jgi:hypothetical protein